MKNMFLIVFMSISVFSMGLPSEYYKINDKKDMKEYFFNYILNIAKQENNHILQDRYFIKNIYKNISKLSKDSSTYKRFAKITKRYKLTSKSTLDDYLKIIDIIPNSLVLAQAAIESGWGKSRFAKLANNIFGQWTWSGKGLDPLQREEGKKHKIKIFSSIQTSVRGYMINLNLGWGYKDFREIRFNLRKEAKVPNGFELSSALLSYSQQKEKYVKIIQDIIVKNKLAKYDEY